MIKRMKIRLSIISVLVILGLLCYLWTWSGETRPSSVIEDREEFNKDSCAVKSSWHQQMPNKELKTSLKDWRFKDIVKCPEFTINDSIVERAKVMLDCKKFHPKIIIQQTNSPRDIFRIPFGNKCLTAAINNCCTDSNPVPNVVHYVWYADGELGYFPFLSFLSAVRFINPCLILIHGNHIPYGKYWNYFVSISPNIIFVQRDIPTEIFGHKLAHKQHASDIMRIEALIVYGGIYLDIDEIVLRSPETLRKYDYTMGQETPNAMGSQFVMATRNASFLYEWYYSYRDNYRDDYRYNALLVPYSLSKSRSNLIHVEGYNFAKPSPEDDYLIFSENYDWSTNYAIHLLVRWYKKTTDVEIIRTLNTTIGSVSRHILLGNKELCAK